MLTLKVLDPDNQLPLADGLVANPQTLAPHDGITVTPILQAVHPDAIEAVLPAEDVPGNVIHVLAQTLSPAYDSFLPIVRK